MFNIAENEKDILDFWNDNNIFKKSVKKDAPSGDYSFYDGPPFATGLPHYGHIVASSIKDMVPRYMTMKGYRVERRWGWDCHGLPVENLIEKELGFKNKKDIEDFGVDKFNEACRASVLRYANDWKEFIPKIGRWVDMDNDYRTMNADFMQSTWWVFKSLWDKDLIYEGHKAMHVCPRCETTLSNFEVTQGYKDIMDLTAIAKFELVDENGVQGTPRTYVLAWTTTPWTLPGNVALAVGADIEYVKVKLSVEEFVIVAKDRVESVMKDREYEVVSEFKGKDLAGKSYKPLFDYFVNDEKIKNKENGWKIYSADFVTTTDGTGVVHIAPAFGDDDMKLGKKNNLPFIQHVKMSGSFVSAVAKDFGEGQVKPKEDSSLMDVEIIKWLVSHDQLFSKEKHKHSYPHCWRCDTPLLNYATSSWFVKVEEIKSKLLANNSKIHWVPENVKDGRFGKWLENSIDWAVSRTRYWGSPLPVWRCSNDGCKDIQVIGGVEEIYQKTRADITKKNYTKVILVRHGKTDYNEKGFVDNSDKAKLNELGIKQSQDLVSKLENITIDAIYSSPLTRCKDTVKFLSQEKGVDVKILENLKEMSLPDFQDKNFDCDILKWNDNKIGGGESIKELYERLSNTLKNIIDENRGKTVVVCSHGDPVVMMQKLAFGFDYNEDRIRHYPKNAEPIEFLVDENYKKVESNRLTKFVVVRHGETMKNVLDLYSCDDTYDLTENGIEQINGVAEKLSVELKTDLDASNVVFVSSPVLRAKHTAEIISKKLELSFSFDDRVREMYAGVWEGTPKHNPENIDAIAYEKMSGEEFFKYKKGGIGESFEDLEKRFLEFYNDMISQHAGKTIVVVSHSGPIMTLINYLQGKDNKEYIKATRDGLKHDDPKVIYVDNTTKKEFDLHKHIVDNIEFDCKCGGKLKRIPEVFDCWYESGAMPYAQLNYPFENKNKFEKMFPAEFIAEGQDQTRGWFYTLVVLGAALFDKPAFKNVVVNGIVLAEDGQKMSKKLKNYPDPNIVLNKYGADALRYYLLSSPVVSSQDLNFSEKGVDEVVKKVILKMVNVLDFYKMAGGSRVEGCELGVESLENNSDKWIIARLNELVKGTSENWDNYYLAEGARLIEDFIDDLSNWYVRINRARFKMGEDRKIALSVLRNVLSTLSKVIAPVMPFIAEYLYKEIDGSLESVHLDKFPKFDEKMIDKKILLETSFVRDVVSLGLSIRKQKNIQTRQPLNNITVVTNDIQKQIVLDNKNVICSELNIKEVEFVSKTEDIAQMQLKPNARVLGPKFGKDVQEVINKAKAGVFEVNNDRVIVDSKWSIDLSDCEVVYIGKEGIDVASDHGVVIALNTEITNELRLEGLAREFVSIVNDIRSDKGLTLADKVSVKFYSDNEDIKNAIEDNQDFIMNSVAAIGVFFVKNGGSEVEMGDGTVNVEIE